MSNTVLEVNNVCKKYCRNLKRSMLYGSVDIFKDTFNIPIDSETLRKDEFWSVNDVSLNLNKGECIGIIGPNGAGKSTLLKMLNGIIKPDKGSIRYQGKMGALIEVGAGFQPILSGRENIMINGIILGLSKKEISKRFDEIVEFSGLEDFLDTPVKNYSSGMRVRLGFSIAAHLHPDILLIDEVLAVGDMSFQVKCRYKIAQMIENGTAIIFISHNMHQIANLCSTTYTMDHGKFIYNGDSNTAIDKYKALCQGNIKTSELGNMDIKVDAVKLFDANGNETDIFNTNDRVAINIDFSSQTTISHPIVAVTIRNLSGNTIASIRNDFDGIDFDNISNGKLSVDIEKLSLLPGIFTIDVSIINSKSFTPYHRVDNAARFQVSGGNTVSGIVHIDHNWHLSNK